MAYIEPASRRVNSLSREKGASVFPDFDDARVRNFPVLILTFKAVEFFEVTACAVVSEVTPHTPLNPSLTHPLPTPHTHQLPPLSPVTGNCSGAYPSSVSMSSDDACPTPCIAGGKVGCFVSGEKKRRAAQNASLVTAPSIPSPAFVAGEASSRPAGRPRKAVKAWDALTQPERLEAIYRAAARAGGKAFSLNFNLRREGSLIFTENPTRLLEQALGKALRKHGLTGLPYSFTLEVCRTTHKVHAHGVVITSGYDEQLVKRAFREAAGEVKGRHAAPRQLNFTPLTNGDGWLRYVSKDAKFTATDLAASKLTSTSHSMKRIAKQSYGQASSKVSEIKPCVRSDTKQTQLPMS